MVWVGVVFGVWEGGDWGELFGVFGVGLDCRLVGEVGLRFGRDS